MISVLIVDDDPAVRRLVSIHLNEAGFYTLQAENGQEALDLLQIKKCDAAVIDVMMPHMDGFELTQTIRDDYDLPIILLTAKSALSDKESGFRSGTDDYLVKPFEPQELIFRLNALLRRYNKQQSANIQIGNTIIDTKSYEVQVGDSSMLLPLKEFELLSFLATSPRQTFSRTQLIDSVWSLDFDGDERTIDVHIKRLRERFKNRHPGFEILTVRGVGYKLEETE